MWYVKIRPGHIPTALGNKPKPWLCHGGAEPTLKSRYERQDMCAGLCSVSLEQGMPTCNVLHGQTSRGKTCTSQLNVPRTTISSTETSWQGTAHAHTVKFSCSPRQRAPGQSACWEWFLAHADSQMRPGGVQVIASSHRPNLPWVVLSLGQFRQIQGSPALLICWCTSSHDVWFMVCMMHSYRVTTIFIYRA